MIRLEIYLLSELQEPMLDVSGHGTRKYSGGFEFF